MTCAVIIPVYKTQPSRTDLLSIEQTLKVLHPRHEVYYLAPEGMDLSAYPPAGVMEAPRRFFTGRKSYSELCCRPELYEALAGYDYMLIMQHDGWVFRDDLDEFMNLNYDYIGAPIIVGAWKFERPLIGNGGVSLRRVKTFIKVCRCYGPRSTEYHPEDPSFVNPKTITVNSREIDGVLRVRAEVDAVGLSQRLTLCRGKESARGIVLRRPKHVGAQAKEKFKNVASGLLVDCVSARGVERAGDPGL